QLNHPACMRLVRRVHGRCQLCAPTVVRRQDREGPSLRTNRDGPFAWKALSWLSYRENEQKYSSNGPEECQALPWFARARHTPSAEEHGDTECEESGTRSERSGREYVDEENPHASDLSAPTEVVERGHQIRSKFFSISRRVSRSITGR